MRHPEIQRRSLLRHQEFQNCSRGGRRATMTPAVGDDGATGVGVREDGGETLDSEALATGGSEGFPLVRQQSLLSLTLDEFQNAVRGPGKSFGSMNMDEFLTNIWNTEEGNVAGAGNDEGELPARQKDLLSVPAPLSRKTVEEVWSDIHWDRREPPPAMAPPPGNTQDMGRSQRQPTFGEMTLEDFLVKAGVVREGGHLPCSSPLPLKQLPLHTQQLHQHQQNGYGLPGGYQTASGHHPEYGHVGGEENTGAADRSYRNYHPRQVLQPGGAGNSYGGSGGERTGNGHAVAASPLSPASSESLDRSNPKSGPWDSGGPRRGGGGGSAPWGRKRVLDGSTEKVVERRQRRMMKNRESAARSRARKQAYTVELEKELTFLKEENARLKDEQRKFAERRRQTLVESMAEQSKANLRRDAKSGRPGIRFCRSCIW